MRKSAWKKGVELYAEELMANYNSKAEAKECAAPMTQRLGLMFKPERSTKPQKWFWKRFFKM